MRELVPRTRRTSRRGAPSSLTLALGLAEPSETADQLGHNPTPMNPDSFIVFAPDVPEEEGHYPAPFDEERLGFFRDLGRAAGSKSIGVGLDRLPPGERTSFTHAHSHEEELIYVLEGEVHVRLIEPGKEPREVPLRAGHLVCFNAGTRVAHCFVNRGDRECRLLTIGERKRGVDRGFYAEDILGG